MPDSARNNVPQVFYIDGVNKPQFSFGYPDDLPVASPKCQINSIKVYQDGDPV